MKKLILILTTLSVFGACKNSAKEDSERRIEELEQQIAVDAAKQATIDSMQTLDERRQRTIDSMKEQQELSTTPVSMPKTVYTHHPKGSSPAGSPQPAVPTTQPVVTTPATTSTTPTPEEKKKGLNNTIKGAIIGAGAGAVTGAVVDKKRGEGAIVGGLIGAGAGAITGAIIDKQKKKKEQARKDSIANALKDTIK